MKPELVAPAGDFDALKAAVHSGADAVYLGGKRFNARIHASNFGLGELKSAIRYVHDRGVRIYITVNTLVADRELCEIDDYLATLYQLEADAVIVQDLGVLELCKALHPSLRVHVSTQATVYNSGGVKFFSNYGVRRIILARELSLAEIHKIKVECSIELEVFVHGALCFSFSGQCLMSSFLGRRSANRGRCASPCRLPYNIVDKNGVPIPTKGAYLLSMKDLNLSEDIGRLVSAQVDAFKIEGRMRSPEYVATVTRIYRRLIDEGGQPTSMEKKDLEAIFNRGFTKGYIDSNSGFEAISYGRPGNEGIEVGIITGYDTNSKTASILLSEDICTGDGLEFKTSSGIEGFVVKRLSVDGEYSHKAIAGSLVRISLPFQILINSQVRKTRDIALLNRARAIYSVPDRMQIANAHNHTMHINRQKGYERLSSILLTPKSERKRMPPRICAEVATLVALKEVVTAGVDEIYFGGFLGPCRFQDLDDYKQAIRISKENNVPLCIVLPRVTRNEELLRKRIDKLAYEGANAFLVGNIGTLELIRQMGLRSYLDSSFNITNRIARNVLFNYASRITLSQELHLSQVARIAGGASGEVEMIVHGPVTLMLSEYCPVSNSISQGDKIVCRRICCNNEFFLKNSKGSLFPIRCDESLHSHLLCSKDICLIDYIPELRASGVELFRIRCHLYPTDILKELVSCYKTALFVDRDSQGEKKLTSLVEKIHRLSRGVTDEHLRYGVE